MNKFYYDKLTDAIKEKELDAMLIVPSEELKFIIGESPYLCERFQGLFVKDDGTCFYVCNLLSAEEIEKALGPDIKVYSWFDCNNFVDTVKQALNENSLIGKKIGVNSTARAFEILEIMKEIDVKFVNERYLLEEIRIHKTDEELENLRIAAKIADNAFEEITKYIKPGMTEIQIKDKMCSLMLVDGVSRAGCLVAVGPNSSYPHYIKNDGIVKEKAVVLLDFGCTYKGLQSDSSRTIFVGEITKKQREVYNIVKEALEAAEKVAAEEVHIPKVDFAARNHIFEKGYGKYFTTRLGHGIGYMGHEAPDIKYNHDRYLEKGMVFSIEPGIYIGGDFGVRIEDIVAITEKGTEILNTSNREIIVI